MTAHTVRSLARARRLLDRRRHEAAAVIAAMAGGASLQLSFSKHGSTWTLSDGAVVSTEVALLIVNDVRVISVNDGLFPTTPQTWRYCEP
jgi:hypothetical protein